jgi:hypothetical protein
MTHSVIQVRSGSRCIPAAGELLPPSGDIPEHLPRRRAYALGIDWGDATAHPAHRVHQPASGGGPARSRDSVRAVARGARDALTRYTRSLSGAYYFVLRRKHCAGSAASTICSRRRRHCAPRLATILG